MIPIYSYTSAPNLNSYNLKIIKYLKHLIKYLLVYLIPRMIGDFLDKLYFGKILDKVLFVRSDCDHFGPWCQLFLLSETEKEFKNHYKFVCAKSNTIDDTWIKFFKTRKMIIIYNPFFHFILSPLFFTKKFAIDVNGQAPLSYFLNDVKYKKFKRISETNNKLLSNLTYKKISYKPKKKLEKIFSRELVLLYGRTGYWKYSRMNSKRNMPPSVFNNLIDIIGEKYNIYLLGDSKKIVNKNKEFLFSDDSLDDKDIQMPLIYKKSKCVIGSVSGSSHFPSILFNKPTLYFADLPFYHLTGLYFLSAYWDKKKNVEDLIIPKNDHWIMIDQNNLSNLNTSSLRIIVEGFLNLHYPNIDDNFYKLNNKSSNEGSVFIHKGYELRMKS